jgi:hypothetical protein
MAIARFGHHDRRFRASRSPVSGIAISHFGGWRSPVSAITIAAADDALRRSAGS